MSILRFNTGARAGESRTSMTWEGSAVSSLPLFPSSMTTKQHTPRSACGLGQLQERVLGEQPPSAFRPPVEDDIDHRD